MGNRESQLLSSGAVGGPAGCLLSRPPSSLGGGVSLGRISSSSSGGGGSSGRDLSLLTFRCRSLASSLSSLGLSLAAFGAPLAEFESPLRSPALSLSPASPSAASPSSPAAVAAASQGTAAAAAASASAAAAAAAHTRPRIHPIVRGGRQLSEDLYWVLPPRTRRRARRPPPPPPPADMDDAGAATEAAAAAAETEAEAPPYGPGRTPLDLVRCVTEQVFGVTDEESYAALSLHRWDQEAAISYLKVEQLFRIGLADRDACRDLLKAHGWRLDAACAAVLLS